MRIKTNIYQISADNGLTHEDYHGWQDTIQARNQDEAIKKARKVFDFPETKIHRIKAKLVFENVEMEVETPKPFEADIDCQTVTWFYDRQALVLDNGGDEIVFDGEDNVRLLKDYLDKLIATF